mmetsp:Transcript_14326/g.45177  ORF Transcript_14326/g.45177 Transcript_14326/m.45177 type:complete len:227 (+) Transcript_14326:13-693(+)
MLPRKRAWGDLAHTRWSPVGSTGCAVHSRLDLKVQASAHSPTACGAYVDARSGLRLEPDVAVSTWLGVLPVLLAKAPDAGCDVVLEPGRSRARGDGAVRGHDDGRRDELRRQRVPHPEQARDLATHAVLAEPLRGRIEGVATPEEGVAAVSVAKGEVAGAVSRDLGQKESGRPRGVALVRRPDVRCHRDALHAVVSANFVLVGDDSKAREGSPPAAPAGGSDDVIV